MHYINLLTYLLMCGITRSAERTFVQAEFNRCSSVSSGVKSRLFFLS